MMMTNAVVSPPSPFWLIASALIGAAAALMSQYVAHLFNRRRENMRFGIQAFEKFRGEFTGDEELRRISKKYYDDKAELTEEEIERYIDFFEDIGLYRYKRLIDIELVDESLGDFIMECYADDNVRKYIYATRGAESDNS
jgi:hypothetical protein